MSILKRILIILVGITVALVVVEIGFRIVLSLASTPKRWNDRPDRYYIPAGSSERPLIETTSAKKANVYRILAIGDSFTFGPNLQLGDTFPTRLEYLLNLSPKALQAEVLNWGIPGYSTAQEYRMLRDGFDKASPDLIVLQITLNDPELKPYRVTHPYLDSHGRPKLEGAIFKWWKSLAFIAQRIMNTATHREYEKYYFDLFNNPDTWNNFNDAVKDFGTFLNKKNVPIIALIFPLFSHPINDKYPFEPLHEKIRQALSQSGIQFVDLLDSYRGIPPERLQVMPGLDSHPNEIAHRIAAETLYFQLAQRKIIPEELTRNRSLRKRL